MATQSSEHSALLPPGPGDVEAMKDQARRNRTRRRGLLALAAMIFMQVAQSEVLQAFERVSHVNKAFFIVSYSHAVTVLLLPGLYLFHRFNEGGVHEDLSLKAVLQRHCILPLSKVLKMAVVLNLLYCSADYFWFKAINDVSVAIAAAIQNVAPLIVYCFSVCLLGEEIMCRKITGVLVAFIGVTIIVIYQDDGSNDASHSSFSLDSTGFIACLFVIISNIFFGIYVVSMVLIVGGDIADLSTLLIFSSFCGLITIPQWIIGSFALAHSPFEWLYETVAWPNTGEGVGLMLLSAFMAGLNSILISLSVCWTSPLEASVGTMLMLPVAGIWDVFLHDLSFSWQCVVGSLLVVAGFALVELTKFRQSTLSSIQEAEVADQLNEAIADVLAQYR